MPSQKLSELQIKAAVLTYLRQRGLLTKNSVIANEFRVGQSSVRADLAIMGDEFIGIEIKSELDSLRRLPAQLEAYLAYFDRVVIVLASKHLLRVDTSKIASNVEICEVSSEGELKSFICPKHLGRSRRSPIALLTQLERRRCELNLPPHIRADAEARELFERQYFKEAFAKRFSKSSAQFWQNVSRRNIQGGDLVHLSRFFDRRQKVKQFAEAQAKRWEEWHAAAEQHLPLTEQA